MGLQSITVFSCLIVFPYDQRTFLVKVLVKRRTLFDRRLFRWFLSPQTVCVCQQGYSGDGQVCEMIDLCRKVGVQMQTNVELQTVGVWTRPRPITAVAPTLQGNGQCHSRAKCNTTAPGVRTCTCRPGWMGDGAYCKGTLREVSVEDGGPGRVTGK